MKTIELLLNEESMSKFSPPHYQRGKIEVWDFIADQELDYFTGNVIKYLCRAGHKDRETELDDLQKARVYIEKKNCTFIMTELKDWFELNLIQVKNI